MADFPISPVVRRVVYTGSAGTGPYAFTFEILAQTDIDVYVDSALKTLTTDYTVTINSNGTGAVNFVTAPGSTKRITIVGARDITRASDYVTGGDFTAASLNVELDQQTIFNQQNAEALGRAILAPVTDPASINMVLPVQTSRAGKILAFDSNGNPVVGEEIGNWRGNWAAGQAYTVRDLVKDASNANVYRANTAHTSVGTTPISSNADVAKWDLVVDAASAGASASAAAASASAAASSASAASTSASNASTSATNAASSASAASTSASNASTSATNASNSASSASSSASTATTQASNASTSASNAATSATSASNSASTATTQATNASNSASAASTSATNASNSASAASTSASNASTSATNASNSASTATTQATNAASSATASANSATSAASSAASAAALLDNFDDRYLGAKTSDPALDNDGNALILGALYFNTTDGVMKVYTASGWIAASSASVATLATFEFVATSGQTVFSGNDANGTSLSYVAPALIVTLNGVRLRPGDDYTATNGTSITLISAAALNDELVVDAFGSFLVANTYTIAQVDALLALEVSQTSSTGAANLPSGTTAQRPGSPLTGQARFNTSLGFVEVYNGTAWRIIDDLPITYAVESIVIAGGGGGGARDSGAGGGAGGLLYTASTTVNTKTGYTVTVGAGGAGRLQASGNGNGTAGSNSVFGSLTAIGGGGGGGNVTSTPGGSGGSGGGGSGEQANTGGSGTSGQGNAGGTGGPVGNRRGAGGGGAGAAGQLGTTSMDGGAGLSTYSTWATATNTGVSGFYAGGGGGSSEGQANAFGAGGSGGGGAGGSSGTGTSGTPNTGGGGGGGGANNGAGSGGSGIVILRYSGAPVGSGGSILTSGGYTYHTFTSSGTFTA